MAADKGKEVVTCGGAYPEFDPRAAAQCLLQRLIWDSPPVLHKVVAQPNEDVGDG